MVVLRWVRGSLGQTCEIDDTTNELADAVFDSMWADDVEVWHSNDNVVQNKEQNLAVLDWMTKNTASVKYVDIVRDITTTGFVQRHVLRLTWQLHSPADP